MKQEEVYRCQFCTEESPASEWGPNDRCPKCRKKYDPILAQEEDDG